LHRAEARLFRRFNDVTMQRIHASYSFAVCTGSADNGVFLFVSPK
jgi:hypothetical protein